MDEPTLQSLSRDMAVFMQEMRMTVAAIDHKTEHAERDHYELQTIQQTLREHLALHGLIDKQMTEIRTIINRWGLIISAILGILGGPDLVGKFLGVFK